MEFQFFIRQKISKCMPVLNGRFIVFFLAVNKVSNLEIFDNAN